MMTDVLLHIVGALLMMAPIALASTPWPIALPWAFAVSLFWFGRELLQARTKAGRWQSPAEWGAWKLAEAVAPCLTAFLFAGAVTVWRLAA